MAIQKKVAKKKVKVFFGNAEKTEGHSFHVKKAIAHIKEAVKAAKLLGKK